ncbi:hypothetical protein [Methanimicrococcus hongohii]|uniref:hypothetical protein n=1 Tax=Methanimicrococcus hongohii TaxID=3028295 RepID=UPI00292FBF3E|nr:hypothetical protein [Methanimicrococcus sp. Hf6]
MFVKNRFAIFQASPICSWRAVFVCSWRAVFVCSWSEVFVCSGGAVSAAAANPFSVCPSDLLCRCCRQTPAGQLPAAARPHKF